MMRVRFHNCRRPGCRACSFIILKGRRAINSSPSPREVIASSYESLVGKCKRRLRGLPEDEVCDAFHDVAIYLLAHEKRNPARWADIRSWPDYLAQATVNAYRRAKRGEGRFLPESALWVEENGRRECRVASREIPPWIKVAQAEISERIHEWVVHLPHQQRRVFKLFLGGCSHGEIARILGMSPGNVRFHKHVALRSFFSHFEVA